MNATTERFLTIQQVSDRLQVSKITVWRLLNKRGLKAMRSGRIVRIPESELAQWIERHSCGANGNAQEVGNGT
jgi:excisionase family DNA binding protein